MNDIQSSDRLLSFYKKLVETDTAIRNLRRSNDKNSAPKVTENYDAEFASAYPDRIKRSLNLFHRPKLFYFKKKRYPTTKSTVVNGKIISKTYVNVTKIKNKMSSRNKRDDDSNAQGLVIEKDTVFIQYKNPKNRIVAKCSHAPKEQKSHEKQLKHPFYKHSQRLDELLDQFWDRRLPDLIFDKFDDNNMPDNKNKLLHEDFDIKEDNIKPDQIDKQETESKPELETKEDTYQNDKGELPASTVEYKDQTVTKKYTNEGKKETEDAKNDNAFETEFLDDSADSTEKKTSSTNNFDILLSISTLMNPLPLPNKGSTPLVYIEKKPNARKLLQYNQDENEDSDYDGVESKTLEDIGDRIKRDEHPLGTTYTILKHPGVHNPNWKGPMPLYPEELTQSAKNVKKEAYPFLNRVAIPIRSQDTAPEAEESEYSQTDVEYIEDYLDNGNEKLVDLAQAYSDYGVLEGKKLPERRDDRKSNPKLQNRKIDRPDTDKPEKGIKRFWGRHKKGTSKEPEGIRIEMLPTSAAHVELIKPKGLYKMLKSHIRVEDSDQSIEAPLMQPSTQSSIASQLLEYQLNNQPMATKTYSVESNFPLTDIKKIQGKSTLKNNVNSADKVPDFSEKYEIVKVKRDIIDSKIQLDIDKSTADEKKDNKLDKTKDNYNYDIGKKEIEATLNKNKVSYTADMKWEERHAQSKNEKKEAQIKENFGDKKQPASEVVDGPNKKTILQNDEMPVADFFLLLTKWFNHMMIHRGGEDKVVNETKITTKTFASQEPDDVQKRVVNAHSTPLIPQDIVKYNSGFRSRGLLSLDTNNTEEEAKADEEYSNDVASSTERMKTNLTKVKRAIAKNTIKKRKVKRQAADSSNLVFWNELYDDEYGIKMEPLENTIRDKHAAENGDLLKKSNTWIHNKIKKMTNKLKKMPGRCNADKQVVTRKTRDTEGIKLKQNEENPKSAKVDFAALTANMKEVCKRTAKIVQDSKNVPVGDRKEGEVADSLMQQLIRLMTDLVDFQVQERTCHSLPPDLKEFLEWLTSSETQDENSETNINNYKLPKRDVDNIEVVSYDKPKEEYDATQQTTLDTSTDCLGTLYAVQDLLKQYEAMSDDDKSILTGVKDYLQHQMNYLQIYLSADYMKFHGEDESRYRRDLKEFGQKIGEAVELTTEIAKYQYKNIKNKIRKFYHKSYNNLKNKTKETMKATKEKISQTKKILDKNKKTSSVNIASKNQHIHGHNDKVKNLKPKDIVFKNENDIKDNIQSIQSKGSTIKSSKLKANKKCVSKGHRPGKNKSRNIQDVYFKAIIESSKVSTKSPKRRFVSVEEEINDVNNEQKLR